VLRGYSDILKMEDRIEFLKRMHALILQQIDAPKSEKEKAKQLVRKEKVAFSYEAVWREAEERRLEEKDERLDALRREAWNLPRVPVSAKEEIVKLIDGGDEVSPRIRKGIGEHANEILRTWSPALVTLVFGKLEIPYDKKRLKGREEQSKLQQEWLTATRRVSLDAKLVHEGQRLIEGEEVVDEEFWAFVRNLLSGPVPRVWRDGIVRFLKTGLTKR